MKKILTAIITGVILVSCLVCLFACNGGEGIKSAKFNAKKADKQLVVATNAEFEPFEYKIGNNFAGVDMEIAKVLADRLGLELVILDMDFESVVTSVGVNCVDVGMAALTVNETRKKSVNFTDSYYNASQAVIVKVGDTTFDACTTAEEVEAILKSKAMKAGFQSGTTGEYYVKGDEDWEFEGYSNIEAKGYDNAGLAVKDMISGAIDIVVTDIAPANAIVSSNNGQVKVINIPLTEEEYAFGVDKNQPELLAEINKILAEMQKDGTFKTIMDKYFNE